MLNIASEYVITSWFTVFLPRIAACHSSSAISKPVDGCHLTMLCRHQQFWLTTCLVLWLSSATAPFTCHSRLCFLLVHSVARAFLFLLCVLTLVCQASWTSRFPSSSWPQLLEALVRVDVYACMLYVTTTLSGLWSSGFLVQFEFCCIQHYMPSPPLVGIYVLAHT